MVHPYPVFGWDFHDYVYGNIPLAGEVLSVGAALERYAPERDRARLRLAVTETGVYDYGYKWQNWQVCGLLSVARGILLLLHLGPSNLIFSYILSHQ